MDGFKLGTEPVLAFRAMRANVSHPGGHCTVARVSDSSAPWKWDADNITSSDTATALALLHGAAFEYRPFWRDGCLRMRAGFVTP